MYSFLIYCFTLAININVTCVYKRNHFADRGMDSLTIICFLQTVSANVKIPLYELSTQFIFGISKAHGFCEAAFSFTF